MTQMPCAPSHAFLSFALSTTARLWRSDRRPAGAARSSLVLEAVVPVVEGEEQPLEQLRRTRVRHEMQLVRAARCDREGDGGDGRAVIRTESSEASGRSATLQVSPRYSSLRKYLNKLFYSILSRSLLRSEEASSFNHATLAQNPVSALA